jgi:hypothetical protein
MFGVCHQFIMRGGGDNEVSVEMIPEDEWRGAELWEVLIQDVSLLALTGHGTGTIRNGRIEVAGIGSVWFGNGLPASDYSSCGPGDMTWTFTRR